MGRVEQEVWYKLWKLMEEEEPENFNAPNNEDTVLNIVKLAQKVLDKHPELGHKILINEETKHYKLVKLN